MYSCRLLSLYLYCKDELDCIFLPAKFTTCRTISITLWRLYPAVGVHKFRQSESSVTLQGALVLRISVLIVGHCSSFSVQTEAFVPTWQPIEVALKELLQFAPTTTRSRTQGWIRRKNEHPLPLPPSKCPLSPLFRQLINLFVNPLQSCKSLFLPQYTTGRLGTWARP